MRVILLVLISGVTSALSAQSPGSGRPLPVREVTIFKDGHAFLFHEGRAETDSTGTVTLDLLPSPVLGTFWPFSAEAGVRLGAAVAGEQRLLLPRPVTGIAELIEANVGMQVTIRTDSLRSFQGVLMGVAADSVRPGAAAPALRDWALVRSGDGVRAFGVSRIGELLFGSPPRTEVPREVARNRLTLRLDWGSTRPQSSAHVGVAYLQLGLQWSPSYRIELDGKGGATVSLQATISNEVTDLDDVTAHLVIGAPSFAMRSRVDPIALQETLTMVTGPLAQSQFGGRFDQFSATYLRTQVGGYRSGETSDSDPATMDPEGERTEDLFIFTVPHLSLRKGERMTLPIARYSVKYTDIYALTVYHAAPPDVMGNLDADAARLTRLLNRPTVMHRLRLVNESQEPFTTAPALILKEGRVLAQGVMTYTASGGSVDLDITKALDVEVDKSETELQRTPSARRWRGSDFARVDLGGSLTLTNRRDVPLNIEVTRYLLGQVDSAAAGSRRSMVNILEDEAYLPPQYSRWWNWYSFPSWWSSVNGVAKLEWKISLAPGARRELRFRWHYFWDA